MVTMMRNRTLECPVLSATTIFARASATTTATPSEDSDPTPPLDRLVGEQAAFEQMAPILLTHGSHPGVALELSQCAPLPTAGENHLLDGNLDPVDLSRIGGPDPIGFELQQAA